MLLNSTKFYTSANFNTGGGRKVLQPELEDTLLSWIDDLRSRNLRVSRKMVQIKASSLHSGTDFKASNGWLQNFFTRHGITIRRRTTVVQKLPEQLTPKLSAYILFVHRLRERHQYDLDNIGAMDETPLYCDMPSDTTLDRVGVRSVPVKSTGHEKSRITVCLAARASGTKLKPMIIFKGVRKDPALNGIRGIVACMSKNGWMNTDLTKTWITDIWGKFTFDRRLLAWDAYRCHLTDEAKRELRQAATDVAVIPGGCTGIIQAPDVSWNAPFKAKYKELYEAWLMDGEHTFTPAGAMRAPSKVQMAIWVQQAWKQ